MVVARTKEAVEELMYISEEEQRGLATGFHEVSERTKRMESDYGVFCPRYQKNGDVMY